MSCKLSAPIWTPTGAVSGPQEDASAQIHGLHLINLVRVDLRAPPVRLPAHDAVVLIQGTCTLCAIRMILFLGPRRIRHFPISKAFSRESGPPARRCRVESEQTVKSAAQSNAWQGNQRPSPSKRATAAAVALAEKNAASMPCRPG